MSKLIRIVQLGLGPIGLQTTRYLLGRDNIKIVGAVDVDLQKVGKDLGELAELQKKLGLEISSSLRSVLDKTSADVAVVTTTSDLGKTFQQIKEIVAQGLNVISSCEELLYPWITNPAIANEIDQRAKEKGVSVLATGVNPGFVMDLLPVVTSGVCMDIKKIVIERIQDAQFRRKPFQQKIGAGLTIGKFGEKVNEGALRHVGLTESMHMIAARIGWKIEKTEENIRPVIAKEEVVVNHTTIPAGSVLGVEQNGRCIVNGEERIKLVFRAAIGEPKARDRIIIKGTPDIEMTIKGGINGDVATCSMIVNAIPVVESAKPGLRTMADIEPVSFFK